MSHGFAGVGQDRTNGRHVRVCPAGLDGVGRLFLWGKRVWGVYIYIAPPVIRRRWGCYGRFGPILDFLDSVFSFVGSDGQRFVVVVFCQLLLALVLVLVQAGLVLVLVSLVVHNLVAIEQR